MAKFYESLKVKGIGWFVSWMMLIVMLLGLGVLAYWHFYPYQTVTVNVQPMKILTPEVKAGGVVRWEIDLCKHTNTPTVIDRRLVDGTVVSYPEKVATAGKGCVVLQVAEEVPAYVEPGTYYIEEIGSNKVSPIKTVYRKYRTEDFQVVE